MVRPGRSGSRPHAFRIVLSHPRKEHSEVAWKQSTEEFVRALEDAFWHFGGVPGTLVIDDLKAAVSRADSYDPDLNAKNPDFCRHFGTVSPLFDHRQAAGKVLLPKLVVLRHRVGVGLGHRTAYFASVSLQCRGVQLRLLAQSAGHSENIPSIPCLYEVQPVTAFLLGNENARNRAGLFRDVDRDSQARSRLRHVAAETAFKLITLGFASSTP